MEISGEAGHRAEPIEAIEGEPADGLDGPPYAPDLDTPIGVRPSRAARACELAKVWNDLDAGAQETLLIVARAWPALAERQRNDLVTALRTVAPNVNACETR